MIGAFTLLDIGSEYSWRILGSPAGQCLVIENSLKSVMNDFFSLAPQALTDTRAL